MMLSTKNTQQNVGDRSYLIGLKYTQALTDYSGGTIGLLDVPNNCEVTIHDLVCMLRSRTNKINTVECSTRQMDKLQIFLTGQMYGNHKNGKTDGTLYVSKNIVKSI